MNNTNDKFDLSYLGLLKVSGPKAKDLLQGQFTCDINEVTANHAIVGAHCNPKGRIISLFRIFLHHDSYYLLMPKELVSLASNALKKYAVFYKVELTDESNTWNIIGCLNQELLTNDDFSISTPEHRYIIFSRQSINNLAPGHYWHQLQLESGFVNIYPETSEKFLPHELNLHLLNGISFKKGCYTGQEIIARMQYLGKLKKQLLLATYHGNAKPLRGSSIYCEDTNVGDLVDFADCKDNSTLLVILTNDVKASLFLDAENSQPIYLKR